MSSSKHRILYLDLLRAFAIVMMLQGHTVHTLLDEQYRNMDSIIYSSWYILRGFTAPLFMFTSGVIFTYLLASYKFSFKENPRVKKGIQRGISLILIGYILRYPAYKIFNFSDVSTKQWLIFFSVDALHLIGVGLLLIIIFVWISSILKINSIITFTFFAIIILVFTPWINSFGFDQCMPIPFSSYFTFKYGSIFPLFPYLQYMLVGSVIGSLLSRKPDFHKSVFANFIILCVGIGIFILSQFLPSILNIPENGSYSQSLSRIGVVLILNSTFVFIAMKIESAPKSISTLARYSLLIYVIHLVILYGSPWSIGLYQIIPTGFPISITILSTLLMITLMILISLRIDKFRLKKKKVYKK